MGSVVADKTRKAAHLVLRLVPQNEIEPACERACVHRPAVGMESGLAQWRAFPNCIGESQDIQAGPKMILQVRPNARTSRSHGTCSRFRTLSHSTNTAPKACPGSACRKRRPNGLAAGGPPPQPLVCGVNGYKIHSELFWKIALGKRAFFINRQPCSAHIEMMLRNGFEIICQIQRHASDGISRAQLAARWQKLSDDDLNCCELFIQARKTAQARPTMSGPTVVSGGTA